jgi:hypothetical protein
VAGALVLFGAGWVAPEAAAVAGTVTPVEVALPAQIRVELDNDTQLFSGNLLPGSDQYYTNGWRAMYLGSGKSLPSAAWSFGNANLFSLGFSAGQNMYTPAVINTPLIQPYDQPFGAWLYVGAIGQLWWHRRLDEHPTSLTVELDGGVVGPWAFGYQFQAGTHWLFRGGDSDGTPPDPKGWSYQIGHAHNFLGANTKTVLQQEIFYTWLADMTVNGTVELGNVFVRTGAGATFRFGYRDHATLRAEQLQIPSFDSLRARDQPPPQAPPPQNFEAYLFGTIQPSYVGWNLFIQGSSDSHGLPVEPFMLDTEIGFVLRAYHFMATWTYVSQSQQARTMPEQSSSGAQPRPFLFAHQFVRIQLAWVFSK